MKAEIASVTEQPAISGSSGEIFVEVRATGATEIERAARVVLAVAGRGHEVENRCDRLAGGELPADEHRLTTDTPKARDRQQHDAFTRCRRAQAFPRRRGNGSEADDFSCGAAACDSQPSCFAVKRQPAGDGVVGWDAQRAVERGKVVLGTTSLFAAL